MYGIFVNCAEIPCGCWKVGNLGEDISGKLALQGGTLLCVHYFTMLCYAGLQYLPSLQPGGLLNGLVPGRQIHEDSRKDDW